MSRPQERIILSSSGDINAFLYLIRSDEGRGVSYFCILTYRKGNLLRGKKKI